MSEFKDGGGVQVLYSRPSAVKAVEENGEHKLLILGAPFGSPADKDHDGEYFSKRTDFMVEQGDRRPVVYMHGLGPNGKPLERPEAVGKAVVKNTNNSGLWFEATVDYTKDLGRRLWDKAKTGKVRASTGAVAHLFRKAEDGEIMTWAIGELSLLDLGMFRRPANDKALAIALKSVYSDAELDYPEAFVEAEKAGADAVIPDGVDTAKESEMSSVIVEQDGMFVVFAADEQGEPVGDPIGAHLTLEEAVAEKDGLTAPVAEEEEPDEVPAKTEETPMEVNETVAAVLEALKAQKEAEQEAEEAEEQIRADERAKVEAEIKAKTPAWKGGFAFPTVSGNDSTNEATDAFLYYLRTGDRIAAKAALQEGTSSEGGFLVPDDFYARIIARRNERSFVRQLGALVITTSRDVVDIPVEGTATTTFVGTAEESNYDQNEVVFDPLSVTVHKFTKFALASNELLADQAANLDEFIMLDFAEKMAMTENRYVAVGSGSTQHWGVFTTDASYAPAIYSLTSDQATAAAVVGSLYTLPAEYRENSAWLMNGVTEGEIRAIKDDTYWAFPSGNSAGGQGFKINSLMDRPLFNQRNISAVSDGTSDAQVRIWAVGDFSKYAIVERAGLEVSRNPYLYQLSDQTAIFAKFRQGGAPMIAEAFVLAETTVNAS